MTNSTFGAREGAWITPISEILSDASNGRMFILIDRDNGGNGAYLVVPAQMATPSAINFMGAHGRGLICLALPRSRADELGLSPLPATGSDGGLEFTQSIEARTGVSTGISTADRARTIAAAVYGTNAESLATPGHVFPVVAREGGVLTRAGYAEAAVDIARLAGLNASAAICAILDEEGSAALMPDLIALGRAANLKIGTIDDLVAHRSRCDRFLHLAEQRVMDCTRGGQWSVETFANPATGEAHLLLRKGDVPPDEPLLVHIARADIAAAIAGGLTDEQRALDFAMSRIARRGQVMIIVLGINRHGAASPSHAQDCAQMLAHHGVGEVMLLSGERLATDELFDGDQAIGELPLVSTATAAAA